MRSNLLAMSLALLVLAPNALGQQSVDTEFPEPAPEFEVEVIVFEYVNGAVGAREDWQYIDTGRERLRSQIDAQRRVDVEALTEATGEPATSQAPEPTTDPKPLVWTRIASDQRNLSETFARMRNSRDYRPLLHAAWTQPVYGEADMTTLALDRVASVPGDLNASASLYVERFLHLTLNLELAKAFRADAADASSTERVTYRLSEKRKMRSGETHFFDHPRFGAVALISKPKTQASVETVQTP